MKSEELAILAKSMEDPRLAGHTAQNWGGRLGPYAITNANIILLVSINMLKIEKFDFKP